MNMIRGLLHEYGIAIPQGISALRKKLVELSEVEITSTTLFFCKDLYEELLGIEGKIENMTIKLRNFFIQIKHAREFKPFLALVNRPPLFCLPSLEMEANIKTEENFRPILALFPSNHRLEVKQSF